jgi:hypothetical protein
VSGGDKLNQLAMDQVASPVTTTATRVTKNSVGGTLPVGYAAFDTTLGYPIWWNGTHWVNASGTSV